MRCTPTAAFQFFPSCFFTEDGTPLFYGEEVFQFFPSYFRASLRARLLSHDLELSILSQLLHPAAAVDLHRRELPQLSILSQLLLEDFAWIASMLQQQLFQFFLSCCPASWWPTSSTITMRRA
jgi:hypothetical protein